MSDIGLDSLIGAAVKRKQFLEVGDSLIKISTLKAMDRHEDIGDFDLIYQIIFRHNDYTEDVVRFFSEKERDEEFVLIKNKLKNDFNIDIL